MNKIFLSLIMLAGLVIANPAFSLNPSRTYHQLPDTYNMVYKEVKIKSNDGTAEINTWQFPAKGPVKGTFVIAHNGEGNMADYLRRVDKFTTMGFRVVTFDYRGYGSSSEFEIDKKTYIYPQFQDDLSSVMDHVISGSGGYLNLYGWGIGGGLVLGVGYSHPKIKTIIADTPFLSMEDLESRFSDLKEPPYVPKSNYETKFEPFHALDNAPPKNLIGIHLIIGSNDFLYNDADMAALRTKQKKLIQVVQVVENPDRKDNFMANKANYFRGIQSFLERVEALNKFKF